MFVKTGNVATMLARVLELEEYTLNSLIPEKWRFLQVKTYLNQPKLLSLLEEEETVQGLGLKQLAALGTMVAYFISKYGFL